MLGPRMTLSIGTTGYSVYIGGLWAYQVHGVRWFLILSGAILGATASLLCKSKEQDHHTKNSPANKLLQGRPRVPS